MNPFRLKYNLTDVNTGTKFPVYLSLTAGSWIKITAWSFVVLSVAAALVKDDDSKETFTEDTTSDYPQF